MLNTLKKLFKSNPNKYLDDGVKQYCRYEFGSDWQYAYNCWLIDKKFPNHPDIRRKSI